MLTKVLDRILSSSDITGQSVIIAPLTQVSSTPDPKALKKSKPTEFSHIASLGE
jgi:hypothetical protein